jgi:hypothetical protein
MPLSDAEISYIRDNSGDDEVTYKVSDATLQLIYNDTALGNTNLNRTVYYVILRLLGKAAKAVDKSNEVDSLSLSSSQWYDHLEKQLALWGSITGIGVASMALTMTSTYTYRADSLQTDEPTYDRGYPSGYPAWWWEDW